MRTIRKSKEDIVKRRKERDGEISEMENMEMERKERSDRLGIQMSREIREISVIRKKIISLRSPNMKKP